MKKGWQTKTLGDVCHVYQPETISQKQMIAGEFRVYGANGQIGWHNQFNHEEPELILGCRGSCGTVHVTEPRSWINGNAMVVHPTNGAMDISFLAYALKGGIELTDAITGAAQPQITRTSLMPLAISFPESLAEQQRIVGLLDEAFEGLATAKANAEKNLQNARALFESHLQSVFTQRGPGWVEKRLADVADFKNGLNFTRQSNGQTLRMVGVGDFQEHSVVPIETLQSVTIDGKLSDDYLIRRDDILTVRSNGSKDLVGRCMLVPDVDGMTSFSGFIIRIRFDTRTLSPRFLLHFMKSSATRERLTRDGGGANISNINQAKLSELPVSLPSFKQQEEIANRLDDLREETQRLASLYERKHAALEALKKSLLHQAFTGQL
ncbi:MAG: restriction endonuclease subunit S [Opitutaceae bacterium]|nr:restriction endonuclease subunit S [Opitutaceae bacterium]